MLNAELKNKINNRNSRSVNRYNPEEVKDGTFEQMILDIKAKPYVSDAQCTRRSVRRSGSRTRFSALAASDQRSRDFSTERKMSI